MKKNNIVWNVSVISEGYEWLVDFGVESEDFIYVVSICADEINWEGLYTDYIHIENIDYLYHVYGQDSEDAIYKCYDLFEKIEKEVLSAII